MREEENVSLPLSSPSKGEEESEAEEESTVLRRPSSGYLGTGEVVTSCCWDPKLEIESMCELVMPSEKMEGEKENLGSTHSSDGREIGGCMLLGGRDCEDFETQLTSEKVGVSTDVNAGVNDQTLDVEITEIVQKFCSSPRDGNGVSVDIGNGSGELIVGVLGAEEDSGHSGLEQALLVEAPKMVTEDEHDGIPSLSPLKTLVGDETLEVEVTEDVQRSCSSPLDANEASVDIGNSLGELVMGRNKAEEECLGVLGVEEESAVEAPKRVTEEEHDEFPELLPLRTLGGDGLGCSSGISIGMEVRYIGGVFDNDRVYNGCEDELPVPSGMAADCPSLKINGHCCPPLSGECMAASENCEATLMEERSEKLLLLESEKVNCGLCSGNELCSNDGSREFILRTGQMLSLEHIGVQKDQSEANINGPSEQISTCHQEVVEEDRCQSSHVEGEVGSSVQGSPNEVASCSATEGLASQQPPRLSTSVDNCSSKLALAPYFQGSEDDVVNGTSACCSNVNSSFGEANNGGQVDTKSSSIIVFRRTNPKRAASLRSSLADGKSDHLTRTRNTGRKCRKAVDTPASFSLSTIKLSNKSRRKRSSSHRPARLSVWGPVENLIKIFEQNGEFASYDCDTIRIQNKRSKKGRPGVGRKKRPMAWKDGIFKVSSAKHAASSHQTMIRVLVGSRTSDCMRTSDRRIDLGNSNNVEAKHKLAGDGCAVGVRSLQRDGQLGDKDLESTLTQETSVDNMLGECPGVSSRIGPEILVETANDRNSLDPGTSPDSDVYHPIIDVGIMTSEGATSTNQTTGTIDVGIVTSEGATSTNQVIGMGQSVLVLEPVAEDDLHAAVSTSSKAFVTPFSVPLLDPEPHTNPKKGMKGKKNGEVSGQPCTLSDHLSIEKLHGPENLNKARKPSRYIKSKQKKRDVSDEKSLVCSKFIKKATRKGSKCKSFPAESSVLGIAELECSEESMKVQNGLETWVLSGQGAINLQSETTRTNKTRGCKLPGSTKSGASKCRSNHAETAGRKRQITHGQKEGNVWKSDNKFNSEEKSRTLDACLDASDGMSFSSETVKPALTMSTQLNMVDIGSDVFIDFCKTNAGSKVVHEDVSSSVMAPVVDQLSQKESNHGLEGQSLPPLVAWVLCDDCEKWRCISVELANIIEETKCKWTCKDNTDKAFADCSIPQEKTDAAINAELGISDEDDPSSAKPSSKGVEPSKLAASHRASWTSIKSNVFMHRNRKTQTIDEIMVCHCKPPRDGSLGCGDQCLNRMLNIECVKGTCPCGDLCSNQQFQKHKYAKFKWFRCGKKGYGLQLQEDASQGQFLIEYVGEVLDLAAYEARQRYYASRGQKHFYFMMLNGGEVIDACAKGNLGRFINHSCDPNCRTEKWMVNGEVCIGIFAIRDIKKGEEVTFDYNYVRVVGAAAKKCVCGSSECRGYIGGDPLNSEVIVQGDSEEEDLEPEMVHEDRERELNVNEAVSDAIDDKVVKHEEISVQREDILIKCSSAFPEPEVCLHIEDTVCRPLPDGNLFDIPLQTSDPIQSEDTMSRPISDVQPLGDSKQSLNSLQTEETMYKPISDIQPLEISLQTKVTSNEVLSGSVLSCKKLIPNLCEEKPNTTKPYSLTKSSRSSGTVKKGRSTVKSLVSHKAKKLAAGTGSGHFEGVEEKLNELLDVDGGISKQKDATKGYLKLLFVTAAEGDVRGCASQSTRDLSLILDAILKTKSRKVLVDVINKNGLQMLHNIMKQNRGNFNRIPIIRKLLKVLEFLALKGILTPEHINRDPPCSGMESFKESMLILTRHSDMQVHQIARNFRDKWIPRTIRRVEPSDRDGGQLDLQHSYRSWFQSSKLKCWHDQGARETDAIVISAAAHLPASSGELDIPVEASSLSQQVSISAPGTENSSASGTRTRKRKSRWDLPSDITSPDPQYFWSVEDQIVEGGPKFMKPTSLQLEQTSQLEVSKQTSGAQREGNSSCDEVASAKNPMQENFDDEAPPGFGSLQKEHHSQVPSEISVATGEVVMGHLQERYLSHLTVSYGIPVALMQQLGTLETGGGSQCNPHWAIAPSMPFHPFPPLPSYPREQPYPREERQQSHAASRTDLTIPSTSGGPVDMVETGCRNSQFNGRVRWPSNGPGKRFFRPQRWNNRRFQRRWPSWPHYRNGCGFRGSIRDGASNLVGNVRRDIEGGFCPPEGVSNDDVSSNFHQQLHHN